MKRKSLFTLLAFLLCASLAQAESSIQSVASAPAASEIEVMVRGEETGKDFVTIVSPEAREGKYAPGYVYTKGKTSVKIRVPAQVGKYELRFLKGDSGYPTIAKADLEVTPVSAQLTAPTEVVAGAKVDIEWQGPEYPKDFITIVKKDAKEGSYGPGYAYPGKPKYARKKRMTLVAPEDPGEYEVRYLVGRERLTLASEPITVKEVLASVEVPEKIEAGTSFEVSFEGPRNDKDFITIVEADAAEGKYGSYAYVRNVTARKPMKLTAPDLPGAYEVRYLSGNKRYTLGSAPIVVSGADATLTADESVSEGSSFFVEWTGPDNPKDFITIVEAGANEGVYGDYTYTRTKFGPRKLNKLSLTAPEKSGDYEIRYLSGQKRLTLGSRPIQVVPVSASVTAPDEAAARDVISVSWEGPGNSNDYIALQKAGEDEPVSESYAYVRRGKTLKINTPKEAGNYEVRYITGGKKRVLASRPIVIVPSKVPGSLRVVSTGAGESTSGLGAQKMNVALILDASGSMLKRDQGKQRRIEVAKDAVQQLIKGSLPEGTPFAMRVFGHKEKDSCRTDLEIPLSPLKKSAAGKTVDGVSAMNYAKTPIAKSLELIQQDMESAEGKRVVILVTDGEETCDGDPEAAIKELAESGFDTTVNIVGFAIDEYMLKETFRSWARIGKGTYFDAQNSEQLKRSLEEAVRLPYEVFNAKDEFVSSGVVNGEALSLLPGTYTLKVLSAPPTSIETVVVEPEKLNQVELPAEDAG